MTPDDELKSVWKAQPLPRQITISADVLLQQLRGNKARFNSEILWSAVFMILGLVVFAFMCIGFGIFCMVRRGAPWEAMSGFFFLGILLLAIAAYTALDRYRHVRRVSLSAPVLACAEESLALMQHEIQLWGNVLWWYLLPLALGVEASVLALAWAKGVHWLVSPLALRMLGIMVIITVGGSWFSRWYLRTYYEPRRQELEALLRELKSQ
ncbi:MAG: hypothetical protein GXX96_16015 [Planctomycetaceae bacterium]|mgnify:CR=1 FL=1|nr:hypothetical protein [Planctomycetaceae bacterium]